MADIKSPSDGAGTGTADSPNRMPCVEDIQVPENLEAKSSALLSLATHLPWLVVAKARCYMY